MTKIGKKIQTMTTAILNRAGLAAKLGMQFGTDRDIYKTLGYPTEMTYADYKAKYSRQDIARAIIDRPVEATWTGNIELINVDDETDVSLQKNWNEIYNVFKLKTQFKRVDKLSSIGQYAVLMLGFNDVNNTQQLKNSVQAGVENKLLYVKPFGEDVVQINTFEKNASNNRFGMPLIYDITISDAEGNNSETVQVHYTRVIHVTGNILDNEIKGDPVLKKVFNRLYDLEKLIGGSAEMFWRGARPGIHGKVDKDFAMGDTLEADVKTQMDEFEHDLRRLLIMEGVELKTLQQQISDPSNHVDVQIQMISAVTGIPKRILTGSERGELSSSEDKTAWLSLIKTRREELAEINIVRPFVRRLMDYNILNENIFNVVWEDLFAQSEKDKVEIGKTRALSLKEYTTNPATEETLPFDIFAKVFLGLTDEQIEQIENFKQEQISQESDITKEEKEIIKDE